MKLVKMMLRYFRGLIGAPIYLIRTYDHVRDISPNRSSPANTIAQKTRRSIKTSSAFPREDAAICWMSTASPVKKSIRRG